MMNLYIPPVDEMKKNTHREEFLNAVDLQTYEMTDMQFFLGQIRFIKKRTWLVQMLVVIGAMLTCYWNQTEYKSVGYMITLLSTFTPFILVSQVGEIARVYTHSMIEIELSTKYSLNKLVTARLSMLGIFDMVLVLGWCLFASMQIQDTIVYMLLYCLAPFNVTLFCYFALLVYGKREHFTLSAFASTLAVQIVYYWFCGRRDDLFGSECIGGWIILYFATLIGCIVMMQKHKKQLVSMQAL